MKFSCPVRFQEQKPNARLKEFAVVRESYRGEKPRGLLVYFPGHAASGVDYGMAMKSVAKRPTQVPATSWHKIHID